MKEHKNTSSQLLTSAFSPDLANNDSSSNSRRKFLKTSVSAFSLSAIQTTGIGLATNLFMHSKAHAGAFINELNRVYEYAEKPPGTSKELCQDEILRKSAVYLINRDSYLEPMRTILAAENQTSDTFTIDFSSWYCEPLTYVAFNTYRRKTGNKLGLRSSQKAHLENYFYHNFSLMRGIEDFYIEHVIAKRWGYHYEYDTEKWLVHNIFACGEENPKVGIVKAQQYLAGDHAKRALLVEDLKNKLLKMKWSELDKADKDKSGTAGKGPLNNWYRLLSAQWGAFFLVNHYNYIEATYGFAREIYALLEEPLQKSVGRLRGPPFYFDFYGNTKA